MGAPKVTAKIGGDDDDFRAQSDLHTLTAAHEISRNSKRIEAARRHLAKRHSSMSRALKAMTRGASIGGSR